MKPHRVCWNCRPPASVAGRRRVLSARRWFQVSTGGHRWARQVPRQRDNLTPRRRTGSRDTALGDTVVRKLPRHARAGCPQRSRPRRADCHENTSHLPSPQRHGNTMDPPPAMVLLEPHGAPSTAVGALVEAGAHGESQRGKQAREDRRRRRPRRRIMQRKPFRGCGRAELFRRIGFRGVVANQTVGGWAGHQEVKTRTDGGDSIQRPGEAVTHNTESPSAIATLGRP